MDYPRLAWNALCLLRERRPLVQNITNFVAMDASANLLLAIGASPAMVHAVEEVEEFGRIADALVVNIGTLSGSLGRGHGEGGARRHGGRQALGSRSGGVWRHQLSDRMGEAAPRAAALPWCAAMPPRSWRWRVRRVR